MNAAVCQGRTVAFIFRVSVKVPALRAHLHTRLLLARMFSLHAERRAAFWGGGAEKLHPCSNHNSTV